MIYAQSSISSGCIKGPQYMHSDDVKAHGAMVITSVTPRCPAILQARLQDFMLEVVLRQAQKSIPNQWIPAIEYKLWFIVSESMGPPNPTEKIDRKLHVSNHLDAITVEDIFRLKHLSNEAGGWCKWDWPDTRVFPGHKPTFVPMSEWRKISTMEAYLNTYIVD
jgi:hypothetical protein